MQEETRKPEIATVDLDTLEHENPRTVGCERLCLKALDDLGFAEILHDLGIRGREGRIASALIVARMVHPASERETSRWLHHDSAAAELLGVSDTVKMAGCTHCRVPSIPSIVHGRQSTNPAQTTLSWRKLRSS